LGNRVIGQLDWLIAALPHWQIDRNDTIAQCANDAMQLLNCPIAQLFNEAVRVARALNDHWVGKQVPWQIK
jgi:hypothetical protein